MKKQNLILAIALAILLTFTALPFSALNVMAKTNELLITVPEGYNAHDYNKCAAFLELTDENGTKNGTKLSETYDVNDPATWGTSYGPDEDWFDNYVPCFSWYDNGSELMLRRVCVENRNLCGEADFSGCTALYIVYCPVNQLTGLDVSGCTSLEFLYCYGNSFGAELNVSGCTALRDLKCASTGITELDVSDCTALTSLSCQINALTTLDVSGCTELIELYCEHNMLTSLELSGCTMLSRLFCPENGLTSLDVSGLPELERLICYSNNLTELDVSANPMLTYLDCTYNDLRLLELSSSDSLPLNTVRSEGGGTFDCEAFITANDVTLHAFPNTGCEFLGWYNENGEHISDGATFTGPWNGETEITAKFSGSAVVHGSGDIDANGETTVVDAILALRIAMGLIDATPEQVEAGDMDNDYGITVMDAVRIMRTAMGI